MLEKKLYIPEINRHQQQHAFRFGKFAKTENAKHGKSEMISGQPTLWKWSEGLLPVQTSAECAQASGLKVK